MKSSKTLTSEMGLGLGMAASNMSAVQKITLAIMPVCMDTFGVALGRSFSAKAEKLAARAVVAASKWSA